LNDVVDKQGKGGNTQKKDNSSIKKDSLSTDIVSKRVKAEYPEMTDTSSNVKSGYFSLKNEVGILMNKIDSLSIETKGLQQDIKTLKLEIETLEKEKK